jgi:ribosomal protein S18 acetylase RimI-like enzyme
VPLILRVATQHDVEEILMLWQSAAENSSRPADTHAAVLAALDRDPESIIVAEDRELVGTIIAGWDGWRCHLYRLAVRPDRRGQGIGRALVDAAENRARGLGATRIDAMVLDGNDLGQAIWLAAGCHRQDDWHRWVKPI